MKTALITGASGGIGEALAYELAQRNYGLILVARNEDKLEAIAARLKDRFGIAVEHITADLGKADGAQIVFDEVQKQGIRVDLLVNNAGIGSSGEFVKNNLQAELDMLQLNNAAMVAMCRLFLPAMVAAKQGDIINIGSLASFFPAPYMAAYAASKVFVRSFTEALTQECKPYGVHVMLFCPGFTSSNFMNTTSNDNQWGKVLTEGAYTQTPQQVAAELAQALERRKTFHVSGWRNLLAARLVSLMPNAMIAHMFAKRSRKKMGL